MEQRYPNAVATLVKEVIGDVVTLTDDKGVTHDFLIPPQLSEYFTPHDVVFVDVTNPMGRLIVGSMVGKDPFEDRRLYMLDTPVVVELAPFRKALLTTEFEV